VQTGTGTVRIPHELRRHLRAANARGHESVTRHVVFLLLLWHHLAGLRWVRLPNRRGSAKHQGHLSVAWEQRNIKHFNLSAIQLVSFFLLDG
jgi:hypothetical protein